MSSLDAPIGEDGDGQVKDIIEDVNMIGPDQQLEEFFNHERAQSILELLSERERKIINMRYGLENGETHTLADIAKQLKVSRERVRQLEAATIKKLRQLIEESENPKIAKDK